MRTGAASRAPMRRILVALDASRASRAALESAAFLAAREGALLEGLFVEDVDLLRTAALPFAGQVALPAGLPLPSASILPDLQALASRARAELEGAASARRLRWSFRVARGRMAVEVVAAALEADLLVLGRGRGIGAGPSPGATAATAAARATSPVLLTLEEAAEALPLLVAWDGSEGAEAALDLALRLSGSGARAPGLLVASEGHAAAEGLAAAAAARAGQALRWRWIGGSTPGDLRRAAPARSVLVVGTSSPVAGGPAGLERLLADARCPILLAR